MHGLQACLFKYITVAAFMLCVVKMPLKGEAGGSADATERTFSHAGSRLNILVPRDSIQVAGSDTCPL